MFSSVSPKVRNRTGKIKRRSKGLSEENSKYNLDFMFKAKVKVKSRSKVTKPGYLHRRFKRQCERSYEA